MKKNLSIFAKNLRFIRKSLGLKQDDFAEEITQLAKDKYTRNIIASYETDRTSPREDFLDSIARYSKYDKKTLVEVDLLDNSKEKRNAVESALKIRVNKNLLTQNKDTCIMCNKKDEELIIKDKLIKRLLSQIELLEDKIESLTENN